MYLPYPSVIITCTNILLFLEICLFLLIDWMFGDIVFFCIFLNFDSLFMLCYAFNLLMAFDRLLLKGLLTYLLIIIIKYIYIAQDREEAANALNNSYKWNRNDKSVSKRRQRDVWCTQFNRKIVPHPRSLDSEAAVAVVCSGAWNSQSSGVSGSKTPAGDC